MQLIKKTRNLFANTKKRFLKAVEAGDTARMKELLIPLAQEVSCGDTAAATTYAQGIGMSVARRDVAMVKAFMQSAFFYTPAGICKKIYASTEKNYLQDDLLHYAAFALDGISPESVATYVEERMNDYRKRGKPLYYNSSIFPDDVIFKVLDMLRPSPVWNGEKWARYAIFGGHTDVFKYLIEKCGVNPDSRNEWGRTLLHIAAVEPNAMAIRTLLEHGADQSLLYDGKTAYDLANGRIKGAFDEYNSKTPAPPPPAPVWQRYGRDPSCIAMTTEDKSLGLRLTEIFNFENRERTKCIENMVTGALSSPETIAYTAADTGLWETAARRYTEIYRTAPPATNNTTLRRQKGYSRRESIQNHTGTVPESR